MSLQGCTLQWTISFIITALISSTSGWQPSNKCGYLRSDHPRSNLPHSTILTLFATNLDGAAADGPATGATPKLPKGAFAPKQSLGQNYLSDQNYVLKIVNALEAGATVGASAARAIAGESNGARVVELGPGAGALSRVLVERYPSMMAIELDGRAVALLAQSLPALTVLESDVLQVNYKALSEIRGGPLVVVGNLPYYITSQILFSFVDCAPVVRRAIVTMQWEVAQRLIAAPNTKDYGILSVVFQLYASPKVNFKIPPTVFYPQPKVDSALVTIDFPETREPFDVSARDLRRVITAAFQQRRKMLRQSLKVLLKEAGEQKKLGTPSDLSSDVEVATQECDTDDKSHSADAVVLPEEWGTKRPEQLAPEDFLTVTELIFGPKQERADGETRIWRHSKHGSW